MLSPERNGWQIASRLSFRRKLSASAGRLQHVRDTAWSGGGVAALLRPEYELLQVVTDGWQLLKAAERIKPDVVTLDISMPKLNGLEAARKLHNLLPRTRIIFLTQEVELRYLKAAFRAGGKGFVAKPSATHEVVSAVRQVVKGGTYITPLLEEPYYALSPSQMQSEENADQLTPRQRQMLQLVGEGHTGKSIAQTLGISGKTVDFHKDQLMTALGVRSTAELTKYAIANGIVVG